MTLYLKLCTIHYGMLIFLKVVIEQYDSIFALFKHMDDKPFWNQRKLVLLVQYCFDSAEILI